MREYRVSFNNITKKIRKIYGGNSSKTKSITNFVRSTPIKIETFHELVMEVGELSYKNPDVMLFYRGQNDNYTNYKYSTLYPTIYRIRGEKNINNEFKVLEKSAKELVELLHKDKNIDSKELNEIKRIKLLQYAILKHYDVCKTPLLDVTQSLKVACSFAILDNKRDIGYVYVLGLPYITGRISANSEEYITNIRLLSIGCSSSKRPFFQEGYLIKSKYSLDDDLRKGKLDFNRRIVAIYEFENNNTFWGEEKPLTEEILYPKQDKMRDICEKIKGNNYLNLQNDDYKKMIGEFICLWNSLEKDVNEKTNEKEFKQKILSIMQKLNFEYEKNMNEIFRLYDFRNTLVYGAVKIKKGCLEREVSKLKKLLKELKISY